MKKEESAYKALMTHDTVWTPERSLWCAVVGQTVIDAASTDREIRQEVVDWLESEDFPTVCGMAGLQPHQIRKVIVGILKNPNTKQAFRSAMSFKIILRNFVESHYGDVDKSKDV